MMQKSANMHYESCCGVIIKPAYPSSKDVVKVIYNGILSKSGADEVIAHVGFGQSWEEARDYKMLRTNAGFEADITMPKPVDTFHICFKDSANNWDNNSGINYNYGVHH